MYLVNLVILWAFKVLRNEPDIDESVLKNIMPLETILSATVSNEKEREDNIDEEEEE